MLASMLGDHRFDDLLKDFSEASHRENVEMYERFQARADRIDANALPSKLERENLHFVKELIAINLDAERHMNVYEIPLQHVFGPHVSILQVWGGCSEPLPLEFRCLAAGAQGWKQP